MLALGLSFFIVKYINHIYLKTRSYVYIIIWVNYGTNHSGTFTINYRNHCFAYSVEIDDTYVIFHPEESILSH